MMIKSKNRIEFTFLFFVFLLASPNQLLAIEGNSFGKTLFKNNCSVCHLGGNNIIIPEKNLKKQTLEENGMSTISAISYQIINGKNGMPAFGGRLTDSEVMKIASYVLEQAEKNFLD